MPEVVETQLPGVGVRHEFTTSDGVRMGVLTHRTGRRELLIYDEADPDSCRTVLRLNGEDRRILADLLGASPVSEHVAAMQQLEGLALDWIEIGPRSPAARRPIKDIALRSRTGVSIVAVLRDHTTVPAPDPDFVLEPGDTAVVVGTSDGITQATHQLRG